MEKSIAEWEIARRTKPTAKSIVPSMPGAELPEMRMMEESTADKAREKILQRSFFPLLPRATGKCYRI